LTALGYNNNRVLNRDWDRLEVQCLEELLNENSQVCPPPGMRRSDLGVRINDKTTRRSRIEGRDFWDIVVFPFTLLLLELEGNSADWAALDTLHQVSGEPRDLVAQAF
jgi:hypothetical protein